MCFPPLTLPDSNPYQPVPLGWDPWQKGDKGRFCGELEPKASLEPLKPMTKGPDLQLPGFLSLLTAGVLVESLNAGSSSSMKQVLSHCLLWQGPGSSCCQSL